jgi:hypothetical protein
LPEPVFLNRFAAARLVLIFGMRLSPCHISEGLGTRSQPPANFSIWRHHRQKSFGAAGFLQAHANSVANAATLI